MAQETAPPRTTRSGPDQDPHEEPPATDPAPAGAPTRRVPLDQLLSVVVLSPAQALVLAVRVLDAVGLALTGNGTHPADTQRWTVALGPAGEVDVRRAPEGQGARTTDLLEQLGQNARRLPAHPRPEQLELLRVLEAAAADPHPEPGPRARQLEGTVTEVLGHDAAPRLAGQLARLVGAFAHIAPSVSATTTPGGSAGVGPDPLRAVPPRRPLDHRAPRRPVVGRPVRRRRRARTRRTALVLLFLAAAVAGSAYVVLRDPGADGTGAAAREDRGTTTTPSGSGAKASQKKATPPARGVATMAPRQAGQVTGVQVQKVGACTPGAPCPVTVTVHLRPSASTQSVVWRVGAARLCSTGTTWSQPVAVTAQPGWTTVYASSSVAVPPGRSLALVALTSAPARAQSPPVPVAGSSPGC